jgi:hypothetical protein
MFNSVLIAIDARMNEPKQFCFELRARTLVILRAITNSRSRLSHNVDAEGRLLSNSHVAIELEIKARAICKDCLCHLSNVLSLYIYIYVYNLVAAKEAV